MICSSRVVERSSFQIVLSTTYALWSENQTKVQLSDIFDITKSHIIVSSIYKVLCVYLEVTVQVYHKFIMRMILKMRRSLFNLLRLLKAVTKVLTGCHRTTFVIF